MCNSWSFRFFFSTFTLYLLFFFRFFYLMVNKVDQCCGTDATVADLSKMEPFWTNEGLCCCMAAQTTELNALTEIKRNSRSTVHFRNIFLL